MNLNARSPVAGWRCRRDLRVLAARSLWGENGEQRTEGESNPRTAFNTLFADVTSGEPDPQAVLRRELKVSMLNGLMEGYRRFSGKLGQADRHIVDAHLDHCAVRDRFDPNRAASAVLHAMHDGVGQHLVERLGEVVERGRETWTRDYHTPGSIRQWLGGRLTSWGDRQHREGGDHKLFFELQYRCGAWWRRKPI